LERICFEASKRLFFCILSEISKDKKMTIIKASIITEIILICIDLNFKVALFSLKYLKKQPYSQSKPY